MTFIKKIDKENPAISNMLFVLCITILGVFLRIQYLQKSDFVINDGGMFYTMILDLQKNNYILPKFTSYNFSQIPYAYPPLSFYTGAVLNQFFHVDMVTLFRLYPLLFNILSIPSVYFLSKEITQVNRQALLATAFYAVLLPSFEWLISGGGLTRSPAHTFFIIALYFYLVFLRKRKWKYLIFSIITASLMTLHHIEYCWMLVFSMVMFSVHYLKFKEYLKFGSIYLAATALLTLPYWGVVVANHGFTPFISAFTAGEFSFIDTFVRLVILVFTEETLIHFINVLAIIGLLYCLFTRKFLIVIWLVLIGFLNPRSANRSLIFPVILLAAIALDQLICPALVLTRKSQNLDTADEKPKSRWLSDPHIYSNFFIAFSIGFPFFLGFINTLGVHPVLSMLSKPELQAMEWIKNNTPQGSTFVVLNPSIEWHMDKLGEWFPALTQRKSFTTIQGTEWLPNSAFEKNKDIYDNFKDCANENADCFSEWARNNQVNFTYLVITKMNSALEKNSNLNYINQSVSNSKEYNPIYDNEVISVYRKTE